MRITIILKNEKILVFTRATMAYIYHGERHWLIIGFYKRPQVFIPIDEIDELYRDDVRIK